MKTLLILQDQLFDAHQIQRVNLEFEKIYICEDMKVHKKYQYHQHRIVFYLAATRNYVRQLQKLNFNVHFDQISLVDEITFEQKLTEFLRKSKTTQLLVYEIEEKHTEKIIFDICKSRGVRIQMMRTPMFLTSRLRFREYLQAESKPLMKSFYEQQRKRFKILVNSNNEPIGGRWSYDEENRKSLPKNYIETYTLQFADDNILSEVKKTVSQLFTNHPGSVHNFWLPTNREQAEKWLKHFLDFKFSGFGPYEDAFSAQHDFINHSALAPLLNIGLLTPEEVIRSALIVGKQNKIEINSIEGFIRQIVGWREFVRGIY